MSEKTYQLNQDSHSRWVAEIAEGVRVGIKVLSEVDPRRVESGEHAYAVLDLDTPLGPLRIRDIRILWSARHERFQLRWRQWKTGKIRNGRPEYLDVAGPQNRETRIRFAEAILDVFLQLKEQAKMGTLGRNPALQELKAAFEQEEAKNADGPAAAPPEEASA